MSPTQIERLRALQAKHGPRLPAMVGIDRSTLMRALAGLRVLDRVRETIAAYLERVD